MNNMISNVEQKRKEQLLNVYGEPLQPCCEDLQAGFTRTGYCEVIAEDIGNHSVCIVASKQFLEFSRFRGNNLSTPMPEFDFPGLKAGDCWCLCAARWLEAYENDMAPKVKLLSTHQAVLTVVPLELLRKFAVDLV